MKLNKLTAATLTAVLGLTAVVPTALANGIGNTRVDEGKPGDNNGLNINDLEDGSGSGYGPGVTEPPKGYEITDPKGNPIPEPAPMPEPTPKPKPADPAKPAPKNGLDQLKKDPKAQNVAGKNNQTQTAKSGVKPAGKVLPKTSAVK